MTKHNIKKNKYLNKFSYTIIGFILIVLVSVPLAKNISKRYYVNKEIKALENEIYDLEDKNMKLEELLEYLDSEEFVEEQARLKLGLKKDGEEAIVVQGLGASELQDNDPNYRIKGIGSNKKENNAQKWFKYFFKEQNFELF